MQPPQLLPCAPTCDGDGAVNRQDGGLLTAVTAAVISGAVLGIIIPQRCLTLSSPLRCLSLGSPQLAQLFCYLMQPVAQVIHLLYSCLPLPIQGPCLLSCKMSDLPD